MSKTDPSIRIADDLALPVDIATDTSAILARKGAGKTYTGAVLFEEDVAVGIPAVALDPMGAFWGLRASADGTKEGLPVTILGGEHGDAPLERTAGKLVADLVVDQPSWYVLDLSSFDSNAAQDQFATDFAERLYRRKAPQEARTPLHLIVDEADSFAPQRAKGQERMLGAYEAIARRGRIRGIGSTFITQRPAVLNKNVLTQSEVIITLQITSPQDRKAVREWAEGHADKEQVDTYLDALASLKRGQAWVWSPTLDLFRQVQIRERRTFDSSATPKPGEKVVEPKKLASVDVAALSTAMAATIEKAAAEDPKKLQARISDLERELRERPTEAVVETIVETERVEVPVLDPDVVSRLEQALARASDQAGALVTAITEASEMLGGAQDALASTAVSAPQMRSENPRSPRSAPERSSTPVSSTPAPAPSGGAPAAFLAVLAYFPDGRTRRQLALQSGYKLTSSTFRNALSTLKRDGLIDVAGDLIRPTESGLDAGIGVAPLPTGKALVDWWRAKIGGGAPGAIFDALLDARHHTFVTVEELAIATGYSAESSTMRNALSKLRTLEIIGRGQPIALTDELLEAIQ